MTSHDIAVAAIAVTIDAAVRRHGVHTDRITGTHDDALTAWALAANHIGRRERELAAKLAAVQRLAAQSLTLSRMCGADAALANCLLQIERAAKEDF